MSRAEENETRIVLSTFEDPGAAESFVRTLVEERLVACGNVVPGLVSIYRWEGTVERSGEVLVVLKSTAGRLNGLLERAAEIHPYEVPELLVLPVKGGHGPYLEWVAEETAEASREEPGSS